MAEATRGWQGVAPLTVLGLAFLLWMSLNSGPWNWEEPGPWSIHAYRALLPVATLALALGATLVLARNADARRAIRRALTGPIGAVLLYAGIGTIAAVLFSPRPAESLYWAGAYASIAVVCILALVGLPVFARGPERRANWLTSLLEFQWIVALGLFALLMALAVRKIDLLSAIGPDAAARLFTSRENDVLWVTANGVGRFAAVVGVVALARLLDPGTRRSALVWRASFLAILLAAVLMLLATKSRGAMAAFGVAALVVVWLHRGALLAFIGAAVGALGAVLLIGVEGILAYARRGQDAELFTTLTGRTHVWAEGIELVRESPLVGYGFQADRFLLGEHMHDAWLQAAVQAGLLGLAFFALAWVLAWRGAFRAGLAGRFAKLGASRGIAVEATAILVLLTIRSIPESTAAFFGVDLFLAIPIFAFLHHVSREERSVASERPRALLCAYDCAPATATQSGEGLLGWRVVEQVSRTHDVDVLVSADHKNAIEERIALEPLPGVRFVYVEDLRMLARIRARQGGIQFAAYAWQVRAYFVAVSLHRRASYDLYHHVTYANDWMASHTGALLDVPFVRGPGGGAHRVPAAFSRPRGARFRAAQVFRSIMQKVLRADPFFIVGHARAKRILVCNEEAMAELAPRHRKKAEFMPVNGVARDEVLAQTIPRVGSTFEIVSAGKLLPLKAFDLGIQAFALAVSKGLDARLTILGEGPERARLEALARSLGVADRVRLPGWRPRSEVLATMESADVFLFTSLRDGGGAVVVEALAMGKPVVCIGIGGPGIHVTPACGFVVAPREPEQAVLDMVVALLRLGREPMLRKRMGAAARERAIEAYSWDRIGSRLTRIYDAATFGGGAGR